MRTNRIANPLFAMVATALLISGCGGDNVGSQLNITGSSTVAPLATEIAKRFEQLHPNIRIDVQSGGSGKGIADARNGIVDIGMASRALKESESDVISHQIAADGVGLIVNQANPIESLTTEQIIGIYYGKFQNWKELGGLDQPITVVHKADGRATQEVFVKHFQIDNTQVDADVIVGDNEHGIKTVSVTPGAVGYVSIGTAEADIEDGVAIRLLPLNGVEATTQNVASGAFPMSRPLNLITSGKLEGPAKEFVDYCLSAEVHDLVKAQYFVPVGK